MANKDQYHPGTIERYGSTHVADKIEHGHYQCFSVGYNQPIPGEDFLIVNVTPRCNGDDDCSEAPQKHRPVVSATVTDVDRNGFKGHLMNVSTVDAKHVHIYWSVIRGGGKVEQKSQAPIVATELRLWG